jgi:hypothetical protein
MRFWGIGFELTASLLQGFCKGYLKCLQLSGTKNKNTNLMHEYTAGAFVA